jgi:hypothetical protein
MQLAIITDCENIMENGYKQSEGTTRAVMKECSNLLTYRK